MTKKTGSSIEEAIPIKNPNEFHNWIDENLGEYGKDWQYPSGFNCHICSKSLDKKLPRYIGKLEAVLSSGIKRIIYFDAKQYFKT